MEILKEINQALVRTVRVSELSDDAIIERRKMANKIVVIAAMVSFGLACLIHYLSHSPDIYLKIILVTGILHSLSTGIKNVIKLNREFNKRQRVAEQG